MFGMIPDWLLGKKPEDALKENAIGVPVALATGGMGGSEGIFSKLFTQPGDATTAGLSKPGLLSQWGDQITGGLDEVNKYAKPIGNVASAANSMQGLLGSHQPAPQMMPGGQNLGQTYAGLLQSQQQLELERMNRRRGLLG